MKFRSKTKTKPEWAIKVVCATHCRVCAKAITSAAYRKMKLRLQGTARIAPQAKFRFREMALKLRSIKSK